MLETTVELDEPIEVRLEVLKLGPQRFALRLLRAELWSMTPNTELRIRSSEVVWVDWTWMLEEGDRLVSARTTRSASAIGKRRVERMIARRRGR